MSRYPLRSSWGKLACAEEHYQALREATMAQLEAPISVSLEEDTQIQLPDLPDGRRQKQFGIWLGPAPVLTPELGSIVGDVIHNLRGALDHAIWSAVQRRGSGRASTPPRRDALSSR